MHKDKGYKRIQWVFIAAAICIGFFVFIAFINMQRTVSKSSTVATSLQSLSNLESLISDIQEIDNAQSDYFITGQQAHIQSMKKSIDDVEKKMKLLATLKGYEKNYKVEINKLNHLVNQKITTSLNAINNRNNNGLDSLKNSLQSIPVQNLNVNISRQALLLADIDRNILFESNREVRSTATIVLWQFLFLAVLFYIVLFKSYQFFTRDYKGKQEYTDRLKHKASIIKSISDPVITTDKDLKIVKWNEYAEELYGWKESEVIGKLAKDVLNTQYLKNSYQSSFENLQKAGVWKGEVMHKHKDGKELYVLATISSIKNDDNELVGTVGLIRDITEIKNTERKLKDLSANLEQEVVQKVSELNSVFNRITDAFIALDNNWNYTYVNDKAAAMHGKTVEQLLGKNIWEIYPEVMEEPFCKALHEAKNTMQSSTVELYFNKTGQWFEDHIYPSENGISVYYHDITDKKKTALELQEAESKFRNLVEESSVGVYIVQQGKCIYVNPSFADIFRYRIEDIIDKMTMLDFVMNEDKQKVSEHFDHKFVEQHHTVHYEFRGVTNDNNVIYTEVFGTHMLYKGEPAIIGTIINITERKKSLQKLKDSEESLRLLNERFRLVAKATNAAIWDWDMHKNTISGNDIFSRIYNEEPEAAITYDDFTSRIHADDAGSVLHNFQQAIKEKHTYLTDEFRIKLNTGSFITVKNSAYILYDVNGMPYRMLGAMEDITLQKRGEQQLMLEKELSDSIINSLPGIFYLINKQGKFYRWNKNFEQVIGYDPEEIKNLDSINLFPEYERERMINKINNVFIYGEDSVEASLINKYGDDTKYYFSGMAISYEGEQCLMGIGFDLSEKILSQRQLIESEEKFRMLIEQASDGIFISNQLGDYIVVNSSAGLLTGYTTEELLKLNMRDVLFEKDLEPSTLRVKELLSGHTVLSEKLIRQKNGNLINVEISSKLLPDGRFQGIVRDISSRKRAEDILRYSEEKRRLIMNASHDAIICMDLEGCITFWNPQSENIFGWKAEEVYGKKLSSIIIPEKFRYLDNGIDNYLRSGREDIINKLLELSATDRFGKNFPIELTVLPIKQGDEEFFCAFIRDITSRKNAEEDLRISEHKYRLLFDQNPLPMWMISLPGRKFLAVNAAAVEFYGYTKDEFLQMHITDLRPEEEINQSGNVISTYKSGINNTGIWEHKTKQGTIVKVNLITHDIIYQGKHAKLVLANDMTEKIIAEEKLKNSHNELRELATHLQNIRESERTHMAREIHDELGQQLTGLKMDISWINRKMVNADSELKMKMQETLKLIDGTVITVRRLATQLRPSILDDLGIVAALEWQSEEFQKRAEIETLFTSNVSTIDVSPEIATGFFRIYQESLTNVSRHAKATLVESALSFKDGLLILSITDNGIGFKSKDIGNKKTLGLLGMKERTLIMGGSYEVTSKPGRGTTVVIIVPVLNKLY